MMSHPFSGRRVNWKALIILVVGAAIVGTGTHLAHGYQVKRNARDLLAEADQARDQGKREEEVRLLSQYVKLVPGDDEAFGRHALVLSEGVAYKKHRDAEFAQNVLRQAHDRLPNDRRVQREFGRASMIIGLPNVARVNLVEAFKSAKEPDLEVAVWLGRLELQAKDKKDPEVIKNEKAAIERLKTAMAVVPRSPEVAVEAASVLRVLAREVYGAAKDDSPQEETERLADEFVHKHVAANPANVGLAATYFARFEKGEEAYKLIVRPGGDGKPLAEETLRIAAEVALLAAGEKEKKAQGEKADPAAAKEAAERLDAAEARLIEGTKRFEKNGWFPLQLAALQRRRSKPTDNELLVKAVAYPPANAEELRLLGDMLIETRQTEQLAKLIELLKSKRNLTLVTWLQARRALFGQDFPGAVTALEECLRQMRVESGNGEQKLEPFAQLMLAQCFGRLGLPDRQLSAAEAALKIQPRWQPAEQEAVAARFALDALDASGKGLDGLRRLSEQGSAVAMLDLARYQVIHLPRSKPADRPAEVQRIEALLKNPKVRAGRELEVDTVWAELRMYEGKHKEAEDFARGVVQKDPKRVPAWLILVAVSEAQRGEKGTAEALDRAEKATGPKAEWLLTRARLALKSGSGEPAARLKPFFAAVESLPTRDEQLRARNRLGDLALAVRDVETARKQFELVRAGKPTDLESRAKLSQLALQAGDSAQAEELIREIRSFDGPESPTAFFAEASLHAIAARTNDRAAHQRAMRAIDGALARRTNWPAAEALKAELIDSGGETETAIALYEKMVDNGLASVTIIRRLVQHYTSQNDHDRARELLQRFPATTNESGPLARLDIELKVRSPKDGDAARQEALQAAVKRATAGGKVADYLWLGRLSLVSGNAAQAESAFRQASKLDPTNPEGWVGLVAVLARSAPAKAAAEFDAAKAAIAPNRRLQALAAMNEALGRSDEARKLYVEAANAEGGNSVAAHKTLVAYLLRVNDREAPAEARKLYTKLQARGTSNDFAWVSRALALLEVMKPGGDVKEAERLLKESHRDRVLTREDKLAQAIVTAAQPLLRDRAISEIENLKKSGRLPTDLKFMLAQLYARADSKRDAIQEFNELAAENPDNAAVATQYARTLLQWQDWTAAEKQIDRLDKLQAPIRVELRARLYAATNRRAEAVKLLVEHANTRGANLASVGLLLDELKFEAEGERVLRRHLEATNDPKAHLLLGRHYAKFNKLDLALAELNNAADRGIEPSVFGAMMVATVRACKAPIDGPSVRAVDQRLEQEATKNPASATLSLLAADLKQYKQDFPGAATMYERIIATDPKNAIALNNLAFLKAHMATGSAGEVRATRSEALDLVDRAVKELPGAPEFLDTRAVILLKLQQRAEAITLLRQVQRHSRSVSNYFHLALAYFEEGNRSAAKSAFEAGNLDSKEIEGQLHYFELSDLDRLRKEFARADDAK